MYNVHITKFAQLRVRCDDFSTYTGGATVTTIPFQDISITPKRSEFLLAVNPHYHLQAQGTSHLISVPVDLPFPGISYKLTHALHVTPALSQYLPC